MKTPLRALALLGLLLASCSPPDGERRPLEAFHEGPEPQTLRVKGEEVFYQGSWVKDGPVIFYDRDGKATHEGSYALGLESGPWSERGEDGILGTGNYVKGSRHGEWEYRYASGELQSSGRYDNGKRVGQWKRWYIDGTLEAELPYKDGSLEGVVKVWDPEGGPDPEASGTFRGGERVR